VQEGGPPSGPRQGGPNLARTKSCRLVPEEEGCRLTGRARERAESCEGTGASMQA